MSTKPAPKTPKTPRCRKVAATPSHPLSQEDYECLYNLLQDANASNQRLVGCGRDLQEARQKLQLAQSGLRVAESDMVTERAENQRIHAELAPLLHRLPA